MKQLTLGLSVCITILLAACHSTETKEQHETYKIISPVITDTVITNEYVAEINALQNVEIRSRINGVIKSILVDEGQFVSKGQTLFTIESNQFQQEVEKAKASIISTKAEVTAAKIELDNIKKLFDKNIISETEFQLAKVKYDIANSKLEKAKINEAQANLTLSYTTIKAPFSGYINRIPNKTGSLIEVSSLLTSISNNKEMFVYFNVSEKDYLEYITSKNEGALKEVFLLLANGKPYPYSGKIETTESEFNKNTGTIAFRARFPNPDQLLKHGATGKIAIKTKLKNAMIIPQKSTFEIQENVYVFVVDSNSIVHQQKIIVAERLPNLYVINSGLSATDRIIYEGLQKVKVGNKIFTQK